ncbi:MAG: hypothetical protein HQ592_16920, partial [Planctomycetes bacterium]|nr:hypothetical protein [Planctomycetota bacterium]
MKVTLVAAMVLTTACAAHAANTDKTLVSWVTLTDRNERAGSVLTIQRGPEFDGIVFAERAPHRWMAGSHLFQRTQEVQDKNPVETADSRILLQMAIVYKGDEITIYRNGKQYTSYKANNIDLLSGKDNVVVFGLRHLGGNGSIAGSIEDARIYSRALSVDELKSLEPNQKSAIEPYAWWDFEGDEVKDRKGQFPESILQGGAKIADGKLVLSVNAVLVANRPFVAVTPAWPENPPENWLTYHLCHPGPGNAMPGDPNPAFYYKGRYHLHYIYNHQGFSFGHVSSKDMVHWKWHPTVLAPPTTGHGMFSGTGFFTKEGKAAMIYHGAGSGRNWVAYALDDNMDKWSKP